MKASRYILPALVAVSLFIFALVCAGCQTRAKKSADVSVKTKGVDYAQSGDTKKGAEIKAGETSVIIPLPSGSVASVTLPTQETAGKIDVTVKGDSSINVISNHASIKGAQSFSPPTPSSQAVADSFKHFVFAGIGLAILAGLLFWAGHAKAGVIAGIGAISVPILGRLVMSEIAYGAFLLTLAISGTLFAAWYIIKRNRALSDSIAEKIHAAQDLALHDVSTIKAKVSTAIKSL